MPTNELDCIISSPYLTASSLGTIGELYSVIPLAVISLDKDGTSGELEDTVKVLKLDIAQGDIGSIDSIIDNVTIDIDSYYTSGKLDSIIKIPTVNINSYYTVGILYSSIYNELLIQSDYTIGNLDSIVRIASVAINTIATRGTFDSTINLCTITVESNYTIGYLDKIKEVDLLQILSLYSSGELDTTIKSPSVVLLSSYTRGELNETIKDIIDIVNNSTTGILDEFISLAIVRISNKLNTSGQIDVYVNVSELYIYGWSNTTGSLEGTISAPAFLNSSSDFSELLSDLSCIVINTNNTAISEYSNYNFISFACINNKYLALGRDGNIYQIENGDYDVTDNINAIMETGLDDVGTAKSKRIINLTAALQTTGDIQYRINTFNGYGNEELINSNYKKTFETRKLKTEKFKLSRVFGIEISNLDSNFFLLDSLEFLVRVVPRRSGGV